MLHSTLPRAFLTPGLKYLSGYYGEEIGQYPGPSSYPVQSEDRYYPRISTDNHHVFVPTWHTVQRSASPCPLDLSLKPTKSELLNVEDSRSVDRYEEESRRLKEIENVERVYREDESPRYHLQTSGPGYQQLPMTPQHNHLQGINAPMTPPSTPSPPQCPRKRVREERSSMSPTLIKQGGDKTPRGKKKHARRLKFDEDTSSPVSGTVILGPDEAVVTGDIDPAFNVVEVTEEARAELAKIENRLGPYQCRLCRHLHEDAFQLAQHRCSRIAHVEYRCPECDKRFSCPANLASHRRWHKPRISPGETATAVTAATATEFVCSKCESKFSRQAALRKHIANQHPEPLINGRTSTGSTSSCSSLLGNVDNRSDNRDQNQNQNLALSPLTVEMP